MTMFLGRDSIQHRIVRGFFSTAGLALGLTAAALFATAFIQFKRVTDENLRLLAGVIGGNSVASLLFDDQQAAAETLRSLTVANSVEAAIVYDKEGGVFARYVRDGVGDAFRRGGEGGARQAEWGEPESRMCRPFVCRRPRCR